MIDWLDKRNFVILAGLSVLSILSLLIGINFGSVHLSESDVLQALAHRGPALSQAIVNDLRIPQAFNAFIIGGLLGLSGTLMQTLLRNPLADPYILGIASGSSLACLLALFLGLMSIHLTLFTFLGGLIAMSIVLGLNYYRSTWNSSQLLLTGIIFAAGCNAIIVIALTLSPTVFMRNLLFWLIGEIYPVSFSAVSGTILIIGLTVCLSLAKPLEIMTLGETKAQSLGINTRYLTIGLYIISAFFTATAVSIAGPIGFVGLLTPHFMRLMGCYRQCPLMIGCVLLGGSLLSLADTLARTVIAPEQLPVGAITALIGVPVFLFLLKSSRP